MTQSSVVIKNSLNLLLGITDRTAFDSIHAQPKSKIIAIGRNSRLKAIIDMAHIIGRIFMYNPFTGYCQGAM